MFVCLEGSLSSFASRISSSTVSSRLADSRIYDLPIPSFHSKSRISAHYAEMKKYFTWRLSSYGDARHVNGRWSIYKILETNDPNSTMEFEKVKIKVQYKCYFEEGAGKIDS